MFKLQIKQKGYFNSKNFKNQAKILVKGDAEPQFNANTINDLLIPLPPLEVQNKIAEEVKSRIQKAEQLQKEAKEELEKAKKEVENIILG
ncbi:MAG: restriction endonuclease subunit S [Candidatus Anstonellaceae archaeon]